MADEKVLFLGIGRNIKGGGKYASLRIDNDVVRVELDPRKFAKSTIEAIAAEVERRIKAITQAPAQSTMNRRMPDGSKRGNAPLFNVSGQFREITIEFVEDAWRVLVGRGVHRSVLQRAVAVAKLSLQALSKAPSVAKAIQEDLPRAIVRIDKYMNRGGRR